MHYLIYNLRELPPTPLLPPTALDTTEQAALARRGGDYLLIRTLLRRELARLIGCAPSEIRLTYQENGKPECAAQPFNLSHSGDLLCLAFHHLAVGVDIERVRPLQHTAALARRIMCAEQLHAWQERGCSADELFDCWCAAEALAKWQGGSIWRAQQMPFLHSGQCIRPLFEQAPVIELFTPAAGYRGAVCYSVGSAGEEAR